MSEKMSINVEVLGINTTHNYIVPSDLIVSKIIDLILKTLSEEYPGAQYDELGKRYLIQESTGKALTQSYAISHLGIVNGERFILI